MFHHDNKGHVHGLVTDTALWKRSSREISKLSKDQLSRQSMSDICKTTQFARLMLKRIILCKYNVSISQVLLLIPSTDCPWWLETLNAASCYTRTAKQLLLVVVAERKSQRLESRRASGVQYAAARPTVSKFVEFQLSVSTWGWRQPLDGAVRRIHCVRFRELLHTKICNGLSLLSRQDTDERAPVQHPEIRDDRTNAGTLVVSTFRGKSTDRDRLRASHAGPRSSNAIARETRVSRNSPNYSPENN